MSAPAVVHVSPHLLADVIACKTKAYTRHVLGYTSRGDAIKALAGQAVHAGIAAHLEGKPALAAFGAVYDAAFARLSADQLEPSLTPTNLRRILDRWVETHPAGMLPWKRVLTVEEAFVSREWTIGEVRVRLIVRPDAVVEDHAGAVRFVDTKTTSWRISDAGWRKELRLSLQFALYVDAVRQRYGARAVLGGWVNAMELRQLPGAADAPVRLKKDGTPMKARACAEHGVPYAECGHEHAKNDIMEAFATEERLAQAVADAHAAAGDFVRLLALPRGAETAAVQPQEGSANRSCRFCPANDWCDAGRPAPALESMLAYEPWPIEEGHRV